MNPNPNNLDYQAALTRLFGRIDYERNTAFPDGLRGLKLERMRQLVDRLGNPEQALKVVHVAGTKGKGSTASMVASILMAAGYRTGLYTSPHLERLEERVSVDGELCPRDEIVDLFGRVWPIVEELDARAPVNGYSGPTFFEITTAMAMLYFASQKTDFAVLEVGLGGRLDSTNICTPLVSVITSISFDHTKQLGNTLALIAGEKAGIIKPGIPVVTGVTNAEPFEVIRSVAAQNQSRLIALGRDFHFETLPQSFMSFREIGPQDEYHLRKVRVGLLGDHQAANASVAIATILRLREQGWKISDDAIRIGLEKVRCTARFEVISRSPSIVLDVAHNVAAIDALVESLQKCLPEKRRVLVFAASRDKDAEGMLRQLLPHFETIVLTRFVNNPRAYDPNSLVEIIHRLYDKPSQTPTILVEKDPHEAIRKSLSRLTPDSVLCVTGSFFLIAEVQAELRGAISVMNTLWRSLLRSTH